MLLRRDPGRDRLAGAWQSSLSSPTLGVSSSCQKGDSVHERLQKQGVTDVTTRQQARTRPGLPHLRSSPTEATRGGLRTPTCGTSDAHDSSTTRGAIKGGQWGPTETGAASRVLLPRLQSPPAPRSRPLSPDDSPRTSLPVLEGALPLAAFLGPHCLSFPPCFPSVPLEPRSAGGFVGPGPARVSGTLSEG